MEDLCSGWPVEQNSDIQIKPFVRSNQFLFLHQMRNFLTCDVDDFHR